jgi:hypothetical protein
MPNLQEELKFLQSEAKKLFESFGRAYHFEAVVTHPTPELGVDEDIFKDIQSFDDNNPIIKKCGSHKTWEQYQILELKEQSRYPTKMFNATWIHSLLWLNKKIKSYGIEEIVDVTGGDGRDSFFAYDVRAINIDIDPSLVKTQKEIGRKTGKNIEVYEGNSRKFDFNSLNLTKPAFLVVEIGHFAYYFLENLRNNSPQLLDNGLFIFNANYRYSTLVHRAKVLEEPLLPTYWSSGIPYSFVKFR